jgi:VWFA-related protein
MKRIAVLLLAVVAAGLQPRGTVSAQEPARQALFRSSAHLIIQTVIVKDKNGKPVEGLTAKDFVVTENGEPQDIAFVEYQKLDGEIGQVGQVVQVAPDLPAPVRPPVMSGADPLFVPRVAIPPSGDTRYRGKRLIILYFDLFNMGFFDKMRVFENSQKYIAQSMTPADMLAVMVFESGRVRLKQDFTSDKSTLQSVIQALVVAADEGREGGGIAFDAGGAFGEDDDTFNLFSTDRQLAALQTTVTDLGPLPEMKTLIYFGSGLRLSGADNLAQLRATVNAAVRSNVTINPIDTRGLMASPPMGDATRASPGGIGMFNGRIAGMATTRAQQSQDSYYALAKDTGGRALFDNNDLSMGIVNAAQAVTGYYMIGYYTKNTATDGKFRRVKVELAAGLNAELSYRPGYYGAKDYAKFNAVDRERQLEEALKAEDPFTDIPIAMEVNYFQLSSAEYFVPISVRMPASDLMRSITGPNAGSSPKVVIDMIGEIKDEYAVTIRNSKDKLEFKLDAAKAAEVARRPIQYETGFTLLPGNYVIKVLARDTVTGRIGTHIKHFVVPNLEREKARIPISTVVLTTQRIMSTDALYTVKQKISADVANPLVSEGQKLIPSVTRTFSASRDLYVFLQAYERDLPVGSTMRPLVAFASFYRDDVKVLDTEPLALSDGWDPKLRAVPIRFSIPLSRLEPGPYDFQVTVLDPASGKAAFWRAMIQVSK